MKSHDAAKAFAKLVLTEHTRFRWTVQGFGMLRTYLPDDMRLNVWSSALAVPEASLIHDHPWDFESYIVAGELRNTRLTEKPVFSTATRVLLEYRVIKPGEGLRFLTPAQRIALHVGHAERYIEGTTYHQAADEVHISDPTDGTVTLNKRTRGERPDEARVFWHVGKEFVSAEPRTATMEEAAEACRYSLQRWFQ